jgi:large subunit ribosomal protein L10
MKDRCPANRKEVKTPMAKPGKIPTKRRGRVFKTSTVGELEKLLSKGDGIVLMNNRGLTVAQTGELRRQLRANNVAVKVAKNTLIKRALESSGYEVGPIEPLLTGPTMLAVGMSDPVSPAKLVTAFLKTAEDKLEIKGGLLEKKLLSAAKVGDLAKLPSREELVARMLGSLQAPAQNMAYALNACVSQVAWALAARQRQLEEESGSAA